MSSTMSHRLTDHLSASAILVNVEVPDKMAAIDIMVDALASDGDVEDLEMVREAVKSREATMSTGVGKGVGLPHAKTGAVRRTRAVFAVLRKPIDFGAFDGEPFFSGDPAIE